MGAQLLYSTEGEIPGYGYYFENVTNIKDVLEQVKSAILGELNMCLLNPGLIIDLFQLQVAISRAVSNRASGQMATKNIYSEILYCLSPSKNIVESFKLFGAVEQSSSLIVVTFDICEQINEVVKGDLRDLKEGIEKNRQLAAAQKIYKIKDSKEPSELVDSIVARIATKHLL